METMHPWLREINSVYQARAKVTESINIIYFQRYSSQVTSSDSSGSSFLLPASSCIPRHKETHLQFLIPPLLVESMAVLTAVGPSSRGVSELSQQWVMPRGHSKSTFTLPPPGEEQQIGFYLLGQLLWPDRRSKRSLCSSLCRDGGNRINSSGHASGHSSVLQIICELHTSQGSQYMASVIDQLCI